VTVCGALDTTLRLGSLVVFDDLYFIANRLPDGSLCSLYDEPGARGRGHWVFDAPFSTELRSALLDGALAAGLEARDGGCYGHVDGPRFNSRSEIASLRGMGVTAVSQTAGPEVVLAGEAQLPYALLGYATDYANGVAAEPTSVEELLRLLRASTLSLDATLAAAIDVLARRTSPPEPTGTMLRFD
jgi:purine nucleoside phosphorylase